MTRFQNKDQLLDTLEIDSSGNVVFDGGIVLGTGSSLQNNSVNSEVLITTRILTAADANKTFYLSLVGGFTVTLPVPSIGLRFRFIVKIAPTTAYIITTNAGANLMYGMMEERAGTAGVAGAARDTFNFVASQSIIGDWVEFDSDGTNWYYHGMVDVAAGNTVAQT